MQSDLHDLGAETERSLSRATRAPRAIFTPEPTPNRYADGRSAFQSDRNRSKCWRHHGRVFARSSMACSGNVALDRNPLLGHLPATLFRWYPLSPLPVRRFGTVLGGRGKRCLPTAPMRPHFAARAPPRLPTRTRCFGLASFSFDQPRFRMLLWENRHLAFAEWVGPPFLRRPYWSPFPSPTAALSTVYLNRIGAAPLSPRCVCSLSFLIVPELTCSWSRDIPVDFSSKLLARLVIAKACAPSTSHKRYHSSDITQHAMLQRPTPSHVLLSLLSIILMLLSGAQLSTQAAVPALTATDPVPSGADTWFEWIHSPIPSVTASTASLDPTSSIAPLPAATSTETALATTNTTVTPNATATPNATVASTVNATASSNAVVSPTNTLTRPPPAQSSSSPDQTIVCIKPARPANCPTEASQGGLSQNDIDEMQNLDLTTMSLCQIAVFQDCMASTYTVACCVSWIQELQN
ncbi:uncharacterized protein BJ171DRAFT_521574 [Polychytrium aggregatum]|uniref:uncharacterized protein n=1 Tax=Polychytrium aggregatum TaxID=110093 RepID=UPI0022FF1D71|nr:uncharacterized protein BJ171DRAFT_521574 [Polychytrium aggregatum]KAI9197219.1 hypothetical protein BJ171DRAFT_521574 [Polychytrium aggregatum]